MVNVGTSERPDLPLAVVVGAGGMGMAIARRLGQHYRLLIADKNAEHVKRSAELLCDEGYDAISAVCDVVDAAAVSALAAQAKNHGPLRVLAQVVGLSPTMADWQTIMRVNLTGARLMADAMLPLAKQGTAAIFISSNGAYLSDPDAETFAILDDPLAPDFIEKLEKKVGDKMHTVLSYCLSKRGLIRMCERAATAWGKQGARIVSLSPGMIATPMGRLEWKNRPIKYELLEKTPLGREGTLMEIAAATEFLASDSASFITGTDLLVDGGSTAATRHDPAPPKI